VLDFITLAVNSGIDRDLVIQAYKRINGGYYVSISYAKSPILYELDSWPRKYVRKPFLAWLQRSQPEMIDKVISLFVTLDVHILHAVSSSLTGLPLNSRVISQDIDNVFSEIKKEATSLGLTIYPEKEELGVNYSLLKDMIIDLVDKRKAEISLDIKDILEDIAYDSEFMEKLKSSKSWIKTVSRGKALKAMILENKFDEFVESEKIKLLYLLASRSLYFDRSLLSNGISNTLNSIRNPDPELASQLNELVDQMKKKLSYF